MLTATSISLMTPAGRRSGLLALSEWQPKAIVGANYFDMASGKGLNATSIGDIEVVAADDCTPRSDAATELSAWLAKFWKRTLGTFVSVVLVDTSGSMPHHLLPAAIRHIQAELKKGASPETVIATFSDSTRFYSPQALEDGSIILRTSGGTALARAVGECRKSVDSQYPDSAHYSVHVLTDLEVSSGEIEDLLRWAASERTSMRVYTWPSEDAERHVQEHPELGRLLEYLPRPEGAHS